MQSLWSLCHGVILFQNLKTEKLLVMIHAYVYCILGTQYRPASKEKIGEIGEKWERTKRNNRK